MTPMSAKSAGKKSGVGIIAPAGPVTPEKIAEGLELLDSAGYRIHPGDHLFGKYRYFSGTISERLSDIQLCLEQKDISLLYAARGGMGSAQLLPFIDFDLWAKTGKRLVGFSDITALQWALWTKSRIPSFSGMTLTSQLRTQNPYLALFWKMLDGKRNEIKYSDLQAEEIVVRRPGSASGLLLGGTLTIISTLTGTSFLPQEVPLILVLEDVNEQLYQVERTLIHLKMVGLLDRVTALILGRFLYKNQPLAIWSGIEHLFPQNIPVLENFPYGHYNRMCPVPFGVMANLEAEPFHLSWKL